VTSDEELLEPPDPEDVISEAEFLRGTEEEWNFAAAQASVLDRFRNRENNTEDKDNGILEDTLYKVGDDIYKTTRSRGSGFLYAKLLDKYGTWQYTPGAMRNITPENRMTLEEAKQYGRTTGTCCQCGAKLTNEASIEAGIGPICAQRW
jgi:hypothetical protein